MISVATKVPTMATNRLATQLGASPISDAANRRNQDSRARKTAACKNLIQIGCLEVRTMTEASPIWRRNEPRVITGQNRIKQSKPRLRSPQKCVMFYTVAGAAHG